MGATDDDAKGAAELTGAVDELCGTAAAEDETAGMAIDISLSSSTTGGVTSSSALSSTAAEAADDDTGAEASDELAGALDVSDELSGALEAADDTADELATGASDETGAEDGWSDA